MRKRLQIQFPLQLHSRASGSFLVICRQLQLSGSFEADSFFLQRCDGAWWNYLCSDPLCMFVLTLCSGCLCDTVHWLIFFISVLNYWLFEVFQLKTCISLEHFLTCCFTVWSTNKSSITERTSQTNFIDLWISVASNCGKTSSFTVMDKNHILCWLL